MAEEQFLRGDAARGVDHYWEGVRVPKVQAGWDVSEKRALERAGGVALGEEVALEGFQGREFGVLGCEIGDVGQEGAGGGGVLRREGGDVGLEGGVRPVGGER